MSNEIWRWADPEGQQRKVQLDELRAGLSGGLIAPNTPVWKPGWKNWQPAHEVPELATTALGAANGVVPNIPPPPLAVLAVQHQLEASGAESFRPPPVAPVGGSDDEPPPPPFYVPAAVKPPVVPSPDSSPELVTGPQSPVRLPASLPTAVGLPPPPELVALAAEKAGPARGTLPSKPPPPVPKPQSTGSGADPNEMIEELSGSMLLDDASLRALPSSEGALPPPSDPVVHPIVNEEMADEPEVVRASPIDQLKKEIANLRAGRPVENKRMLIVAGVVGGSVVIIVLGLFVSLVKAVFGGGSTTSTNTPVPSATTSVSATATASATATEPTPSAKPAEPTPSAVVTAPKETPKATLAFGDCTAAGEAKSIGWRAVVPSGVEAASFAGSLAIGFASNPRDGIALNLDPTTLAVTATVKGRALAGDAKRVTPLLVGGKLAVVADSDRKGDKLATRRVVATIPPIDVGVAENAIVWAPHGKDSWAKLFPLAADGPVEAIRAVPLATSKGVAIAFRQSGSIYVGVAKGEAVLEPEGKLQAIAGLGQVGSPSIAASGDTIVLAWADRAEGSAPWGVRWTKVPVAGAPEAPKSLALPEGGLGEQAMSPSVASLGAGRFLLAWTEGPVSSHQVRAQSFGPDGPSGGAIAISPTGTNAGQPQATVGPDGKGLVAFLAAKGKGYEVHAAPLSCPAK